MTDAREGTILADVVGWRLADLCWRVLQVDKSLSFGKLLIRQIPIKFHNLNIEIIVILADAHVKRILETIRSSINTHLGVVFGLGEPDALLRQTGKASAGSGGLELQ
jgi:hypothetical protein